MKQQHAAVMTLGMMLMLACCGITAEERGRGSFKRQVEFTAIGVPTLKNAPFIALVQSTWVRPTGEGDPHVLRCTARIMRDSAGTGCIPVPSPGSSPKLAPGYVSDMSLGRHRFR